MADRRRSLRALIDESQTPNRQVYLMTAAVVSPRAASYNRLMAELEAEAREHHRGDLHAYAIASNPATRDRLPALESIVADSPAVQFITTVRAPVLNSQEEARQRCLADLAIELTTRHQVGELIFDSRTGGPDQRAVRGNPDAIDIATVRALMGEGRVPMATRLEHRHDRDFHGLWLPDIAAYAAQQSIAGNDPERLARLARKMQLREATAVPVDQRGDHPTHARTRPSGLDVRLAELRAWSEKTAAQLDRDAGYQASDQPRVDTAAERLREASERLKRISSEIDARAKRTGRPVPPLEAYTRADGRSRDH